MAPTSSTIWDGVYVVKQEDEESTIPRNNRFVLYAIAQDPPGDPHHPPVRPPTASQSGRPIPGPSAGPAYPPPIFPTRRFRLPLPPDTDMSFRHEVRVNGQLGLQLSTCCSVDEDVQHLPLLRSIMHQVEGAGTSMSHYCFGQYVWIERAYFPTEKGIRDENRVTPKHRDANFTRADMLAFMIEKQHKHWSHVAVWDEVDLEPLIGCCAIWAKGSKASWDSIYITAIRRRQSRATDGSIRWFPELEVCVR
ncbi:hypothetical protein BV20DRAFT_955165 [Pilatotrama ljubarskyi]|nr:hypothetical protein BV20DRAFT_955165 [Pilatotrama ljubarskyi]